MGSLRSCRSESKDKPWVTELERLLIAGYAFNEDSQKGEVATWSEQASRFLSEWVPRLGNVKLHEDILPPPHSAVIGLRVLEEANLELRDIDLISNGARDLGYLIDLIQDGAGDDQTVEAMKELLRGGALIDPLCRSTLMVFIEACEHGDLEMVQLLVNAGLDLDLPRVNSRNPFDHREVVSAGVFGARIAVLEGHVDLLKYLLSVASVDINGADKKGLTLLGLAETRKLKMFEIVKVLTDNASGEGPGGEDQPVTEAPHGESET